MNKEFILVETWLEQVAHSLEKNEDPPEDLYNIWFEKPGRILTLLDVVAAYPPGAMDTQENEFSAAVVALDICVANLQSALENGQKSAQGMFDRIMDKLTEKMLERQHGLFFWLPFLNVFYEIQVELSAPLKNAYLLLASEASVNDLPVEDVVEDIRSWIKELSHYNIFEIAEHIFAQSHAMPPEFFAEMLFDLFSLEEGQEIGLLSLMHPNPEIRRTALEVLGEVLPDLLLNEVSLSRLQAIRHWYFDADRALIESWIKDQRKKGAVFSSIPTAKNIRIRACEIDGSGTQGIILRMSHRRKPVLAGMLFKYTCGIKDIWSNTLESKAHLDQRFKAIFNAELYSREVNIDYLVQLINHFLQETLAMGAMPALQLLHLQEMLGIQFVPEYLDAEVLIAAMTVDIQPFTPDLIEDALHHSRDWIKKAPFTGSWFEESPAVDAEVNQCCNFKDGTKICDLSKAVDQVVHNVFAQEREKWRFHFLWNALWLKSKAKARERSWRDCLLIAYVIDQGMDFADIPVIGDIAQQSVLNSLETMNERRAHLHTL